MGLNIRPMTSAIGAEITGVDLRKPLSEEETAAIRAAWRKHLVVFFRDQKLEPAHQVAFSRLLGNVDSKNVTSVFNPAGHPDILVLTNELQDGKPSETRDVGWQWHSDLTYTPRPCAGAVLYAMAIPKDGGDTMFANQYLAYETLSSAYKEMLERLEAIHDIANGLWFSKRAPKAGQGEPVSASAKKFMNTPAVVQPMVRVHPETGRKALMIGETYVKCIYGMTEEESEPILRFLMAHATTPEFVYTHRWQAGDILVWDNWCTMHKVAATHNEVAEPGSVGQVRRMHRVTLAGYPSGRLLEPMAASA